MTEETNKKLEELLSIANKQNKPVVFEGKDQGRYEDIRDILYELLNNDKYTRSAIECDLKWFTERFRYMKPQPNVEWSEEMKDAVDAAYKMAHTGEIVLLSPCCASFDLFKSYEDRGDQFKACVRAL
jgi:UDP-N-acetylmuramoylalanine--D-glutamate ligase